MPAGGPKTRVGMVLFPALGRQLSPDAVTVKRAGLQAERRALVERLARELGLRGPP